MIILEESALTQEFNIIPRKNAADKVVITGIEGDTEYLFIPTYTSYYMTVSGIFNLKEGQQYTFIVYDDTDEVHRGRIFCTNQDINNFSINDGEYTETTSNNDFIIV